MTQPQSMRSMYVYAVVDDRGQLALLSGQCDIYWRRYVAQARCNNLTRAAKNKNAFRVVKVVIGDANVTVFTPRTK